MMMMNVSSNPRVIRWSSSWTFAKSADILRKDYLNGVGRKEYPSGKNRFSFQNTLEGEMPQATTQTRNLRTDWWNRIES